MELSEYILIGVGTCLSIIGSFLKRAQKRLDSVENRLDEVNVTLAKNGVRDEERWTSVDKRLEDRRNDIRKLYDLAQSGK